MMRSQFRARGLVPRDLRLPYRSQWFVLVVVGVECLCRGLAERLLAAEPRVLKGLARPLQVKEEVGDNLLSTRMSSSGRSRSRSAWVYAENKPLKVLGVPLVPPRCGICRRRR